MRIADARWTPSVNVLVIQCNCGHRFDHRSDRWWATCPKCRNRENLAQVRQTYLDEHDHSPPTEP